MRKRTKMTLAGLTAGLLLAGVAQAWASSPADDGPSKERPARAHAPDDMAHPLGDKQRAMKKEALAKTINGQTTMQRRGKSNVVKLADGQYVQMSQEKQDQILTFLVEFGDQQMYGGEAGPARNEIPIPDRDWNGNKTDDNSTYWVSDFNRKHYQEMLFADDKESMRDFYRKQSSGRYTVTGDVADWVKVPYNEARYGNNDHESPNPDDPNDPDGGLWNMVADSATAWYNAQKAAGKTDEQIKQYLATFDKWDRYDHDQDGNFDEPDGYVDHFQYIHAGEGEEAGGGAEGGDAIWSHRWYAFADDLGQTGPAGNKLGGTQIGDTGLWIGDYTAEPENGALGVFTHEFGHDLGLPDLYDTSGGDNGTGFWSLMSGGSWLNKGFDSIGTSAGYMGPWEKWVLGWLDYEVVPYQGAKTKINLGPAGRQTDGGAQAAIVTLPDQKVVREYNKPSSGTYEWWGGSADGLNVTLARELDLTSAQSATLTAKGWFDIEEGYDYLYAEVSPDGGQTWERAGSKSGSSNGQWVDFGVDLAKYAGKKVQFRYRYQTDGGVHYAGAFLDDITLTVNGAPAWSDDVEAGTGEWASAGWSRMTGTTTDYKPRFYIAENRAYVDYDDTLRTGPYNFGWANTKPNWVERFPYQNGLLVWYVNYAYEDNNTNAAPGSGGHPGYGNVLPVDARPAPVKFEDGALLGNRRQPWDATFGLERTDRVTFHRNGTEVVVDPQRPIPLFDDSNADRYWSSENPMSSVKVAGAGVRIKVLKQSKNGNTMTIEVSFK